MCDSYIEICYGIKHSLHHKGYAVHHANGHFTLQSANEKFHTVVIRYVLAYSDIQEWDHLGYASILFALPY